jgi:uncharacterized cofD-like protein
VTQISAPVKAVALGGGHGLHVTLSALRRVTPDVTAVVTVADDGGSSGRLRRELGLLPPGDLRKALLALAEAEHGDHWSRVLAGLLEVLGDPVAALDEAARLLDVRGRVLPMSREPMDIQAEVTGLDEDCRAVRRIRGQVAVATTPGRVLRIQLHPAGRPGEAPVACPEAVRAVIDADVVLLGPGSWFTSVLVHLLVDELRQALISTRAKRVVVLNLVPQPGETAGFSPEQHLDALSRHAPGLRIDVVLADVDSVPGPEVLRRAAGELGARTYFGSIAAPGPVARHDPVALARALQDALMTGQLAGSGLTGQQPRREEGQGGDDSLGQG